MADFVVVTGRDSVLEGVFKHPIILDPGKTHYIGLGEFVAYNSIPNVDHTNQLFYYSGGPENQQQEIIIPKGAYEIQAIEEFLKDKLGSDNISLKANNNTLRCILKSTYNIDFSKPGTIGSLLGFSPRVFAANEKHESELPVNIMSVNMIRLECNIANGSYVNGEPSHAIYTFSPNVPPGYKMALSPQNPFFCRINTHSIDRLRISIVDQDGRPVDFGEETVSVRLHIKSV